ncbi:hypothetical protein BXT84_12750 [Sulfobacillus thermotolerans]|uniref:DUF2249 domain-containing protein n=1 Tax=Sulfobacillus thermotolerans TaxID=338644 RepID=A0ABN5H6M8_9FIRM|nr:hypothetical protein BXT84_12750 [Sulfobacillus thermotolerans]
MREARGDKDPRRICRHLTILAAFDALPQGFSALLINDHDPKPLLYQLEAEQPGAFEADYQESGPIRFSILLKRAAAKVVH